MFEPFVRDFLEDCTSIFRSNIPTYFAADEESAWRTFVLASGEPYFVLRDGDRIVACGGIGTDRAPGVADLCWGMVTADRHGEGFGHKLTMARLNRIAQMLEVHSVRLVTTQHTDRFYARFGFRVRSVQPDGLGAGQDSVEMILLLDDAVRERLRQTAADQLSDPAPSRPTPVRPARP